MAGDEHYHPKDAVKAAFHAAGVVGTSGFFVAAVHNALQRENVGALSVFTRSGGIIAVFAIGGGAYNFTKIASANLRQKNDPWNSALGGFVAGSVIGMTRRRMPVVLGLGAFVSATMGAFEFTGARLRGWADRPEEDEFERKIAMRANRRRPIEETIAEIGEGRGIRPEGYEERRRERLKAKYGVDINPVKATVE
ncbi:NADH-ubiquinone oxidoreductase 21.3 kDa subunit [Sodiomyces alkalinus F11]|uniref:NADH-ubiquinone oxidoreductase 21.3 kDa subunit n=1 Tax=Sodiomyces alkalinus (strain CBS 110278 / VKM F-3762 / F11) TaxID=1314773 RepID=A0A3N2PN26_SODAK|nr:NADH-ubiquinone oxidoreductase 21.3 kDa subunit [Sodiomyces alkalinus F11]ROT35746.1 NADH-ubiquinone oxidoreductase 21.3 kDa subunit [Sodiomyces alkalinus F11]